MFWETGGKESSVASPRLMCVCEGPLASYHLQTRCPVVTSPKFLPDVPSFNPMTLSIPQQHILVVDDEPMVQEALQLMLIHHGHTVELASDGPEALQKIAKQKFDVIFTDLKMPEMRGDELARHIRKEYPSQFIIMISAYSNLLTPRQRQETPVDLFVNKPFQLQTIFTVLETAHKTNEVNRKRAEPALPPPS
jgi:CheY-like chemotaxis protein